MRYEKCAGLCSQYSFIKLSEVQLIRRLLLSETSTSNFGTPKENMISRKGVQNTSVALIWKFNLLLRGLRVFWLNKYVCAICDVGSLE